MKSFDELLREARARAGISGNALARAVTEAGLSLDPSYLNRIERGEREPPRRELVEALAAALRLAPAERDDLLVAAGHLPAAMARVGPLDPTLRLVADILADESIPPGQRALFREAIALLAERWRPGPR